MARLWDSASALCVATMMMWACNAIAGQLAVGEIAPMTLVLLRWVLVVVALTPFYGPALLRAAPVLLKRPLFALFLAVTGFTGFNTLFYVASVHTSGLNIGILQGAMPVIVMLGALVVYGTRITGVQAFGVAVTLIGALTVASGGDVGAVLGLRFNQGDVLMFIALTLYCAYTVGLQKRPEVPGAVLFMGLAVLAMITSVPLAAWEISGADYAPPTLTGWAVVAFVAIFPSCLAQIFFMRAVDLIGPGRAGVYINLVPIFAAILAILVLGEALGWHHGLALILVCGGIWLAQRGGR